MSRFQLFFDIRAEERTKAFFMFFYFFLTLAVIYILKPVRSALFLTELGAGNLRYVYMGEGVFLAFAVAVYVQFARRVSKEIFYAGVLGFFALNLAVFWFLFRLRIPYLSAAFYIWVATFSITITTQFWTLANDLFNPAEAKRLFGFIASGGSLGGVVGGLLAHACVPWFGTEGLLLLAAGMLAACIAVVYFLWSALPHAGAEAARAPEVKAKGKTSGEPEVTPRKIFGASSYLILLGMIVIIAKMASTIADNQFNKVVELSILGKDERTAFFGQFMSGLNGVSFFMQLFLTSVCLRVLGVGISLWILPVGLTFASLGTLFYPALLSSMILKVFDGSVNYSVQQASKEVLFLPLASSLRYRVKPVIDMLGFRVAKSLGGVVIAVFAPLLALSDERFGILVLGLIPVWLVVAWQMKLGYFRLLREHVIKRGRQKKVKTAIRATEVLSFLHDEKAFEQLQSYMNHDSTIARKLAAAAYLAYDSADRDLAAAKRTVEQLIREEALDKDRKNLDRTVLSPEEQKFLTECGPGNFTKIEMILNDENASFEEKRKAVRILEVTGTQEVSDLLQSALVGSEDHALRFLLVKSLGHLRQRSPGLTLNRFFIKNEIFREGKIYEKINFLTSYYYEVSHPESSRTYLTTALKAVADESLERLFFLLHLLYPKEEIQLVYEELVSSPEGDPVKAQALELLSGTLETSLMILIQRLFDKSRHAKMNIPQVANHLKFFANSRDRWFAIFAQFYAGALGLKEVLKNTGETTAGVS